MPGRKKPEPLKKKPGRRKVKSRLPKKTQKPIFRFMADADIAEIKGRLKLLGWQQAALKRQGARAKLIESLEDSRKQYQSIIRRINLALKEAPKGMAASLKTAKAVQVLHKEKKRYLSVLKKIDIRIELEKLGGVKKKIRLVEKKETGPKTNAEMVNIYWNSKLSEEENIKRIAGWIAIGPKSLRSLVATMKFKGLLKPEKKKR